MCRATSILVSSLAALCATCFEHAAAAELFAPEQLQVVSPGDLLRFEEVADSCPTFSWAGAAEVAVELLVYRVGEDGDWQPQPTIRERLPAGATSFTPSAALCFSAGLYAWSVRPLGAAPREGAGAPDVLLFRVPEPLDEPELLRAVAVVRRWLAQRPDFEAESLEGPAARHPVSGPAPAARRSLEARDAVGAKRQATPAIGGGGNLKVSGDYLYDAPRLFHFVVGPEQFASGASNFQHGEDFAFDGSGTGWEAYAHPNFPHGSHVTQLVCYYQDRGDGTVTSFGFAFYKRSVGASPTTPITSTSVFPADEANISVLTTVDVADFDETVHSANDVYRLSVHLDSSGPSTNQRFYGCRFGYTVDRASTQ